MRPRALVGCECSGAIRRALRARGWDAWSCDLKPAEDGDQHHIQGDVLKHLRDGWTLAIIHPVCKYLTNSANRWLYEDRADMTATRRWELLKEGAAFYIACRDAPIEYVATENPVMSRHAKAIIQPRNRQVIQPHWFGDPYFKATGFELRNLPPLKRTHHMALPKAGTPEHKAWSKVHRMPPGPNRETERSRTFPGVADAIAEQWGGYVMDRLQQLREAA
jgi:hypothetical protein